MHALCFGDVFDYCNGFTVFACSTEVQVWAVHCEASCIQLHLHNRASTFLVFYKNKYIRKFIYSNRTVTHLERLLTQTVVDLWQFIAHVTKEYIHLYSINFDICFMPS